MGGSVFQSVYAAYCHRSKPCKNSWTDQDAIWVEDSVGPRNHVQDGVQMPHGRENFSGKGQYRDSAVSYANIAELFTVVWGLGSDGPKETCIRWGPDAPIGMGD